MKKITPLLIIIAVIISCNDSNEADTVIIPPTAQLPSATQTGANTFGCLLDGEVFKPGITNNSYNCFYQFVDGDYYFLVTAKNTKNNNVRSIFVGTQKQTISEGEILNLFERSDGNAWGTYFLNSDPFTTNATDTGELKITKLDFMHNIVSGTFWFDVKDNQNVVHHITEGRFDMQFTQ